MSGERDVGLKWKIKERGSNIKYVLSLPTYSFLFFFFFFGYISIQIYVNDLFMTLPSLIERGVYFIFFIAFHILSGALIALSLILAIVRIQELREMSIHSGTSVFALTISLLAGGCPGCLAGLFPAMMSIFGITASLSILPFYGFELQVISIILSLVSVYFLSGDLVCRV